MKHSSIGGGLQPRRGGISVEKYRQLIDLSPVGAAFIEICDKNDTENR